MNVFGYDNAHRLVRLPNTLEEYFSGAAKRFSHISEIHLEYGSGADDRRSLESSDGDVAERDAASGDRFISGEAEKLSVAGGVMKGDFALLRAFLADHDGALLVRIVGNGFGDIAHLNENGNVAGREKFVRAEMQHTVELFFPAYLYGFVEDTFARAIHHKIEGSGYACRECVGKYEIRLREYDRLLHRVADDDRGAAVRMAFCRLLHPMDLADAHRQGYEDFLKENDALALETLAARESDLAAEVGYLTEHKLLSKSAVEHILPKLSEERYAEAVAVLLRYQSGRRGRISI